MAKGTDYAGFLAKKDHLVEVFQEAILETIQRMGENAKGVDWFSARADEVHREQVKKAA